MTAEDEFYNNATYQTTRVANASVEAAEAWRDAALAGKGLLNILEREALGRQYQQATIEPTGIYRMADLEIIFRVSRRTIGRWIEQGLFPPGWRAARDLYWDGKSILDCLRSKPKRKD